jgi:16S rRNA (cytidine1402-2'-O)-methyltransferase
MARQRQAQASRTAAARAISSPQNIRGERSDDGSISKPETAAAGLVIVATPIGNLGDIAPRALDAMRGATLIACEDTRVTGKLLARAGIPTPRVAYHEHNASRMRPLLIERMQRGESIVLVSDAGTPLISDPGYKLVRAALAAGISVTAIPGPSAVLAALVLSGLPTDRFLFAGFLPSRAGPRRSELAEFVDLRATLVFFEAPGRLTESLADMAAVLGAREAAVARELTKLYEEVRRGSLPDLHRLFAVAPPPKGEVVIVVGPPLAPAAKSDAEIDEALRKALKSASLRDAVAAVAAATGAARRRIYTRALALAGNAR